MKKDWFLRFYGRSVSLTNLVTNGSFTSKTGWTDNDYGTSTVADNEISMTAWAAYGGTSQATVTMTSGRKYYVCEWLYGASNQIIFYVYDGTTLTQTSHSGGGSYEFLSAIHTAGQTNASSRYACFQDQRSSGFTQMKAKYASCIDLTSAFGSGNEPTKAQMDTLMTQFANNWLDGTKTAIYNW